MARSISLKPTRTGPPSKPWRVNIPAKISESGKRERRFFETKAVADTFAQQQRTQRENFGNRSTLLTPGQLEEAARAFERLKELGVSLNVVVSEYIQRHDARAQSVTFKVLWERFTATKAKKSTEHKTALKYTFTRFEDLHEKLACDISSGEIDRATAGMPASARNAFLRNLRAGFNFGMQQDPPWLAENPVRKLKFSETPPRTKECFTPAQCLALLNAAVEHDFELVPYFALALFAGIRPEKELGQLEWAKINLADRNITVEWQTAKNNHTRQVDMERVLRAWLRFYIGRGGKTTGAVTPTENLRKRLRALRKAAGITRWIQDGPRKCYASYWLARKPDYARLLKNMGHTTQKMIDEHYNAAPTRKDALVFWKILPPRVSSKIVPMVAAA